jgi:hypothetical protein
MKSTWRLIWITALMGLLCTGGAALITMRAAAQEQTIEDDPTAVPDPKESADNNVSFPVDI